MSTLTDILASYGGRQPTSDEVTILNAMGGHQPSGGGGGIAASISPFDLSTNDNSSYLVLMAM